MGSASGPGSSPTSPWWRRSAAASDPWKSLERDTQDRWGRAAARILPTVVGTGCRPSATSTHLGSTPKRAAVTGASRPLPVGSSASGRLGRTPCGAAWTRDPGHDALRLRGRCAMPPRRAQLGDTEPTLRHFRRRVRHFRSHPRRAGSGNRSPGCGGGRLRTRMRLSGHFLRIIHQRYAHIDINLLHLAIDTFPPRVALPPTEGK